MIHEIIFAGALLFHPQAEKDSIGTETIDGKLFVIHKVDEKETLYAISRRYGASVESILKSNPGASANLEIGQILRVPYDKKVSVKPAPNNTVHRVASGETMYSISRSYGVTVDDLRKWNNLPDNSISVGQELIVRKAPAVVVKTEQEVSKSNNKEEATRPVPASGLHTVASKETLYSIARQYGLSVSQVRSWNSLENDELKVGQVIAISASAKIPQPETEAVATPARQQPDPGTAQQREEPVVAAAPRGNETAPVADRTQTIRISESVKNSDEIVQAGLAELIEGTEGNRKYLAMHRTAPIGTILKVRNEMNNREVFVRVMGKLPDTGVNDKLIIKLSRSAYDRLGAIDPRFRVEVTYYK